MQVCSQEQSGEDDIIEEDLLGSSQLHHSGQRLGDEEKNTIVELPTFMFASFPDFNIGSFYDGKRRYFEIGVFAKGQVKNKPKICSDKVMKGFQVKGKDSRSWQ